MALGGEAEVLPGRAAADSSVEARGPTPAVLALAAVSLPLGIYGEWAFSRTGAAPPTLLYDLIVGWTFVAAGLVASRRQPRLRSSLLMVLEGLTWFLTNLQGSGEPPLVFVGVLLGVLNEAVLIHLVLTFPTGRASSRGDLAVILAAYALSVLGGLAFLDSAGPPYDPYRCQGCTAAIVLLSGDRALLGIAQVASEGMGTLVGLVVVALVCRRWFGSTATERRVLAPLWLSLGTCLLLTASHALAVLQVQIVGPVSQAAVWVSDVVQMAVPVGFLLVALRLRMARAAVSELVLELGPDMSLAGIRPALALALGDASVEVGSWDESSRSYRDPAGQLIELPGPRDSRIARPVEHAGHPVAVLICDGALGCDPQLIQTIASALRMVAERAQLLQRLHGQLEELRASRARIAEAGDAARRRLERDLHDGAQQRFVLLSMTLTSTLRQLSELPDATDLQATVARATNEVRQGLAELRELARGIHPTLVTDRGLASAVESLVARMQIPVEVAMVVDRFPAPVEVAAYYVVCEALTNVARHAGASHARVSARAERGRLVVEVVDDGSGGASLESGSGLRGIADRVATLGGALYVESPCGRGTRVRAELPWS